MSLMLRLLAFLFFCLGSVLLFLLLSRVFLWFGLGMVWFGLVCRSCASVDGVCVRVCGGGRGVRAAHTHSTATPPSLPQTHIKPQRARICTAHAHATQKHRTHLVRDVEDVADEGHDAKHKVQPLVEHHARDDALGQVELQGAALDVHTHTRAVHVTEEGHEADDAVFVLFGFVLFGFVWFVCLFVGAI